MSKADLEYQKFLIESVEDPEVDKQMDSIIDEMIGQGEEKFTDDQIVDRLSSVAGLAK